MATIADVAHAAGVSISTVSYVMSGKRTISQKTRERVERAIAELNFSPHASARSLASRSTNVIGLQAPLRSGVDVHVIMEIVAGVVREARAHHYDILLLTSDDAEGLSRAARASRVDALLVMDVESHDPRIGTLLELETPSILIGLPAGADGITCVDFDFEAAGRLAVERLAALGHRRVALFGAPLEVVQRHTSYADRLSGGFLRACEELGLEGTVHACPSSSEAVAAVDAVLDADPGITGILFHNESALPHVAARLFADESDAAAAASASDAGAGARASDAAAAVRRDVIALCPADVARSVPGLTDSIDLPAEELGVAATRALLQLLEGQEPPRAQLLPPRLSGVGGEPAGAGAAEPADAAEAKSAAEAKDAAEPTG